MMTVKKPSIEVIPVGCPVVIGEHIEAVITAICIKENSHVTYECVWWSNNTRNCAWLAHFEVKRNKVVDLEKIGFVVK